jgi:hypothetical protein
VCASAGHVQLEIVRRNLVESRNERRAVVTHLLVDFAAAHDLREHLEIHVFISVTSKASLRWTCQMCWCDGDPRVARWCRHLLVGESRGRMREDFAPRASGPRMIGQGLFSGHTLRRVTLICEGREELWSLEARAMCWGWTRRPWKWSELLFLADGAGQMPEKAASPPRRGHKRGHAGA